MRNGRRVEPPSELVYVASPSWAPVLAGAGLAVVAIGLFAGWVYSVVGGIIAVAALWGWIRSTGTEIQRRRTRSGNNRRLGRPAPPSGGGDRLYGSLLDGKVDHPATQVRRT